ncbi:MAG: FimB/Mfa2 family fimbrial subunit [Tannerellaceae bacterium]|jgi:hypothetical protein|nr:FimB/Mfa2 family fimbrial subunit [Tannerellaceae bacterium]
MMRIISLISILLLSLAACTSEETALDRDIDNGGDNNSGNKKEAIVSFALDMPSALSTRSLSEDDENTVTEITLLQFDRDNNNKEHLRYISRTTSITSPGTPSNPSKTFTAKVLEGAYNIVALANASSANLNSGYYGLEKSAILDSFIYHNPGKLALANKSIPSWGETGLMNIVASQSTPISISMTRMMAKVNVKLAPKALPDFDITKIFVYNQSSNGALVPDPNAYNSSQKLTMPTAPKDSGFCKMLYPTPALMYEEGKDWTGVDSCNNAIYLYEAPKGTPTTMMENTCIVVGGSYLGHPESYYRIDFVGKDSNGQDEWLPILRNHLYTLNISDVTGDGAKDPDDAFKSKSSNLVANIMAWDETTITDIIFDNQYMLGVSRRKIELGKNIYDSNTQCGDTNKLSIITSVPAGWTIDPNEITDVNGMPVNWLRVSQAAATAADKLEEISIYADENTAIKYRKAYINIKARNLTCKIEVRQYGLASPNSPKLQYIFKQRYTMDGTQKTFSVAGERSWDIIGLKDTGRVLTTTFAPISGGSNQSVTEEAVTFTLTKRLPATVNDLKNFKEYSSGVEVYFEDALGEIDTVRFVASTPVFFHNTFYWQYEMLVWPEDQPTGYMWKEYANYRTNGSANTGTPNQYSCANLEPRGSWVLPNRDQMGAVLKHAFSKGLWSDWNLKDVTVFYPGRNYNTTDPNDMGNVYWTSDHAADPSGQSKFAFIMGFDPKATDPSGVLRPVPADKAKYEKNATEKINSNGAKYMIYARCIYQGKKI